MTNIVISEWPRILKNWFTSIVAKNVVADHFEYYGYEKIGNVAPTPLTKVINQHMSNGSEVEIVYCGKANDPHPDSYHAEHYLKIIAK